MFCSHANCARSFFINQNYWGCPLDAGWMVVLDPHHYCCTWDNLPNKPVFLYSSLDVAVTYQSGILGTGICQNCVLHPFSPLASRSHIDWLIGWLISWLVAWCLTPFRNISVNYQPHSTAGTCHSVYLHPFKSKWKFKGGGGG